MARSRARRALLLLAAIGWVATVHMLLLARGAPVVHAIAITIADWPGTAPPLRIALLSDTHVSAPSDTPARLAGVVALVDRTRPDLVLLAGDFLGTMQIETRHYSVDRSIAPLAGLRAPLGVLAVPGNHDRFNDALDHVRAALARAGIPLLVNRVVRRGPLAILGLDDYGTGRRDVPGVVAQWRRLGGIPLALTHDPAMLRALPPAVRLRLAGHTHCGQISPPPFGALVSGTAAGMGYVCGVVRDEDALTIVTGGIGTSILPMRLGASPDFWLIDLGPPRRPFKEAGSARAKRSSALSRTASQPSS